MRHVIRYIGGLCFVISVFVATGCSSGDGENDSVETSIAEQIKQKAAKQESTGNESQASLLSDGVVTDANFRQAVNDARECMRNEGLDVSEVEKMPTLESYDLTFNFEPGSRSDAEAMGIADECEQEHSNAVRESWGLQSAQQLSSEGKSLLNQCYEENGLESIDAQTLDDFQQQTPEESLDVWQQCLTEASEKIAD